VGQLEKEEEEEEDDDDDDDEQKEEEKGRKYDDTHKLGKAREPRSDMESTFE
jgi:hypothetical protein